MSETRTKQKMTRFSERELEVVEEGLSKSYATTLSEYIRKAALKKAEDDIERADHHNQTTD